MFDSMVDLQIDVEPVVGQNMKIVNHLAVC
jgi:hypothetical protein